VRDEIARETSLSDLINTWRLIENCIIMLLYF